MGSLSFLCKSRIRIALCAAAILLVILISSLLLYSHLFGPASKDITTEEFIIGPGMTTEEVSEQLQYIGIAKSAVAMRFAFLKNDYSGDIQPGGFNISRSMDAWSIAKVLTEPPAIAFVTFPPAIRKEQMGDILADALRWNDEQKNEWNTAATSLDPNFIEGVYYPGTYLIPSDQSPAQIAARLRGRFTDMFAPYAAEALQKNIPWPKVLTLASIIDREAAKNDKSLVAGILWNRIDTGMKLQADATLQYAKGTEGNWWPTPTSDDKYLNSPFNTYKYIGLPPHPIDNPSLESIEAALNPTDTDCLYYLHDNNHQIHCSVTYAGQVQNVKTYLQ